MNPGGSMTGQTFPTGNRQDTFVVTPPDPSLLPEPFPVRATLIDVSNPFIFVDAATLPALYHTSGPDSEVALEIIEAIRRQGAVFLGLAKDTETAGLRRGTPKIALLSEASSPHDDDDDCDISVLAYSMGKVHPSFQLTGAVCLGAAVCLPGTVAADLAWRKRQKDGHTAVNGVMTKDDRKVIIAHRSGTIDVAVRINANAEEEEEDDDDDNSSIHSVTVYRTARRLFEGHILVTV
jgi:2-methylaconitate cis-trans-isomerase PrpF